MRCRCNGCLGTQCRCNGCLGTRCRCNGCLGTRCRCNGCLGTRCRCNGCLGTRCRCNGCLGTRCRCNGCLGTLCRCNGCLGMRCRCNGCLGTLCRCNGCLGTRCRCNGCLGTRCRWNGCLGHIAVRSNKVFSIESFTQTALLSPTSVFQTEPGNFMVPLVKWQHQISKTTINKWVETNSCLMGEGASIHFNVGPKLVCSLGGGGGALPFYPVLHSHIVLGSRCLKYVQLYYTSYCVWYNNFNLVLS